MTDPLDCFARYVQTDPFFLGSILTAYCRLEQLDDAGLARSLGCSLEDLVMLRLCRSPREESPGFRDDLLIICQRFQLDIATLSRVVKRGRVVLHLQSGIEANMGHFMAARDRDEEPPLE